MFTGGDGHMRYGQSLQKMADIAAEYVPKTNDKGPLRCQYVLAMNQIKLTEHLIHLSDSLRKHRPMLMRK